MVNTSQPIKRILTAMSWKRLTIDDVKLVLAQDEIDKLSELSLSPELTSVVNDTCDLIASTWRGAIQAKGNSIDPRDFYLPSCYWYHALAMIRQALWTRFPNSGVIALDERRVKEYEAAMELLKQPYLEVDKVEWYLPDGTPNPELSAYTQDGTGGSSMLTPWLRFPDDVPMIEDWKPWTWKPSEVVQ